MGVIERAAGSWRWDGFARSALLGVAPLGTALACVAVADGAAGGVSRGLAWLAVTAAWGLAGTALLLRTGDARLATLALWISLLTGGAAFEKAAIAQPLAVAILPAALLHVLLALPSGELATAGSKIVVVAAYLLSAVVSALLWTQWPATPAWPVALEAVVAAAVGVQFAAARYRVSRGHERRRMHWVAAAIALTMEVLLVAGTLHVLVDWPPRLLDTAAFAMLPVPVALLVSAWPRQQRSAEGAVHAVVSAVGLTALVAAAYLVVVVGLGRAPTHDERTLLVLSIVAAAVSAVLYVPARERLSAFSNRLVYGDREAPEELVRTFAARLSRAVPLEELLLQLVETLRRALALDAAEAWTGSSGTLERVVSEPDRRAASVHLTDAEAAIIARTGVAGPARIGVWLPQLLSDRGDAQVRVAPIAYAGELFGLIVVERPADGPAFDEEADALLGELARHIGLALRNVRLDSELQASLDELRRQAVELSASRARVVAAADAERRRIERDLHDGAQQYLVGMAANLGVVRSLTSSDPEQAQALLDELQQSIQGAMQAFRDLAHGIYPPLLQDRGLAEALANAARQANLPTVVDARGVGRYDPGVEATVYFCCLEALQNAAKHAGDGARATVRVWEEAGDLLFEVADDGVGLDVAPGRPGAGLTNMQDRVAAVGGTLRIESARGSGATVVGAIPLERYSRSAR